MPHPLAHSTSSPEESFHDVVKSLCKNKERITLKTHTATITGIIDRVEKDFLIIEGNLYFPCTAIEYIRLIDQEII